MYEFCSLLLDADVVPLVRGGLPSHGVLLGSVWRLDAELVECAMEYCHSHSEGLTRSVSC